MKLPNALIPSTIAGSNVKAGGQPAVPARTFSAPASTDKIVLQAAGRSAQADPAELEKELDAANLKLANDGREIRFEYDRDASKVIVRLVDTSTQEVLRQFPSNEALRLARQVRSGKPLLNTLA